MPLTRRKVDGTAARALVERSRDAQLTYAPVGISLGWAPAPHGFRTRTTERVVGQGSSAFAKVGEALMTWQLHRQAGFHMEPQHNQIREGERVGIVLPLPGLFGVSAICNVVAVVAEGDTIGFAYGSLPKHPLQGEESFIVSHRPDDSVVLTVTAVTRPAAWFVKLAGPIASAKETKTTQRYLNAAAHFAQAPASMHAEP